MVYRSLSCLAILRNLSIREKKYIKKKDYKFDYEDQKPYYRNLTGLNLKWKQPHEN